MRTAGYHSNRTTGPVLTLDRVSFVYSYHVIVHAADFLFLRLLLTRKKRYSTRLETNVSVS